MKIRVFNIYNERNKIEALYQSIALNLCPKTLNILKNKRIVENIISRGKLFLLEIVYEYIQQCAKYSAVH
jgi:hypothetical protein